MEIAFVSGSFDDLRSADILFLEEAARAGELHVDLWADDLVLRLDGNPPRFPQEERLYLLQSIRYVSQIHLLEELSERDALPYVRERYGATWIVNEENDNLRKRIFSASHGLKYQVVNRIASKDLPKELETDLKTPARDKRVIVTGCFDWFHSGHVRFFEEVSQLGDLYVVVGSDQNVRLLKGAGHPMFTQEERRYVVQSVRFVKQALISSGNGWLDAEPEIAQIKPQFYAVNEDGDKPEKRDFCESRGIQYVVLKRKPKEGLPRRQSVDLRGF